MTTSATTFVHRELGTTKVSVIPAAVQHSRNTPLNRVVAPAVSDVYFL